MGNVEREWGTGNTPYFIQTFEHSNIQTFLTSHLPLLGFREANPNGGVRKVITSVSWCAIDFPATTTRKAQMHFCSDAQMPRSVKTALAVLTDRVQCGIVKYLI